MTRFAAVFLLALPFLVFGWMAPFIGGLTISHDYVVYAIENQLELQFAIATGEWPLFAPGFAAGAPAAALMLGQLYHPISHLAAALPGYWDGLALEWNSALRLLSLGLTQLVLFVFLRRLAIAPTIAFGISLVTVYNLRMLDLFRYGASLEGYTATLLLCTALAWHFAEPSRRLGPAAIALSTALLLVSGHPQVSYYGLLAAAIVWGLAPALVRTVAPECGSAPWRYWWTAALSVLAGIAAAAIFWLPLQIEFISENAGRFDQSYAWSTNLQTTWLDLARNFSLPLASDVHGAFAGSALALVALLTPIFGGRTTPRVVWGLFTIALVALLFSLGDQTPVHQFFWAWLPGQSSMRIPGRATLLLPVLLFWLLAWRFRADQPKTQLFNRELHGAVPPLLASAVVAILIAAICWKQDAAPFAPQAIRTIPEFIPLALLACGLIVVVALGTWLRPGRARAIAEPIFIGALLAQVAITMGYGTWIGPKPDMPTFDDWKNRKEQLLDYPSAYGYGMYSADTLQQLERTFLQPELARLYFQAEPVSSREEAWSRLAQGRNPELALIERPALELDDGAGDSFSGQVSLAWAGFNRNVFETRSNAPAILAVSFAHSDRWKVTIDGEAFPTYRVNGYETAVMLPPGIHTVALTYDSPATRIGGWISLLALVALASWLIFAPGSKHLRLYCAASLAVALITLRLVAGPTLKDSDGIGTRFEWRYAGPNRFEDLAYGRATRSSEVLLPENLHLVHASRAVDGSVSTAFISAPGNSPWWEVELAGDQPVKRIVLLRRTEPEFASGFEVLLTDVDGRQRLITAQARGKRVEIPVSPPMPLRTVRIIAPGQATLALGSVRIYGEDGRGRR